MKRRDEWQQQKKIKYIAHQNEWKFIEHGNEKNS